MPFNLPRATRILLIANIAVFLLQWLVGTERMALLELWPIGAGEAGDDIPSFMPWQLVTSGFMHGNFGHLFFNMLALVMFGAPVEYLWGQRRFVTYYLACIAGAAFCHLAFATWSFEAHQEIFSAVGASGGVYGLVLAYGLLFPHQKAAIFPIPMLLSARTVAILYGVFALGYGVFGTDGGVRHLPHLGGMLAGYLLIRYWQGQPPFRGRKPPNRRPPLRVVR